MGYQLFTAGAFDAKLCATACQQHNKYAVEHTRTVSKPQLCRYFNTYILLNTGVFQGQGCSVYTQEWAQSLTTNDGQWGGNDHYTFQYSFEVTDETNDGSTVCLNDLVYLKSSGQEICISFIGYSAPATTATANATGTATSTLPLRMTAVTRTCTTTTQTADVAVIMACSGQLDRRYARRADDGSAEIRTCVIVDPYEVAILADKTLTPDDDPSLPKFNGIMTSQLNRLQKRAIATAASITSWPTEKISAACSLIATSTLTVAATTISTIAMTENAPLSTSEALQVQTVIVAHTSTCTAHRPQSIATSYTKICGGEPSDGVPMVSRPGDQVYYDSFNLALPFPVTMVDASSTQITLTVRGTISFGGYTFNVFSDELHVYQGWREGVVYRVDGAVGSRNFHFS